MLLFLWNSLKRRPAMVNKIQEYEAMQKRMREVLKRLQQEAQERLRVPKKLTFDDLPNYRKIVAGRNRRK